MFHDLIKEGVPLIDDGIMDAQILPVIPEELQEAHSPHGKRKQWKAPVARALKRPRRPVNESESEVESLSLTQSD